VRSTISFGATSTTPGSVAYRGALFAAFREVVEEHGLVTSWLELLQLTNERLCAWSALRPSGMPLPSMDIRSTCRGMAFAPSDIVAQGLEEGVEAWLEEEDLGLEEGSEEGLELQEGILNLKK